MKIVLLLVIAFSVNCYSQVRVKENIKQQEIMSETDSAPRPVKSAGTKKSNVKK